jgi:hypothetical protein
MGARGGAEAPRPRHRRAAAEAVLNTPDPSGAGVRLIITNALHALPIEILA